MKKLRLQTMIEVAIFASLALLLDLLPSLQFGPSISISFAMVPILLIAFRWGFLAAATSGFLWGVLQVTIGEAWILTPLQAFIEYFVAFACVGFAGLFMRPIKQSLKNNKTTTAMSWIVLAVYVGAFARYFWHFLAGIIFFASYAEEAGQAPFIYSFTMNGIAYFFTALACSIVLVLILSKSARLITSAKQTENKKIA
ncbi:energy-coupled thiamine transporter ThiT [Oceanobacillus bengalensis]|uniref:Energy-coupled thiamine transporter ThiT n=1 Tax=Oceanobacillus bengalensis TaxID=1435466 RepID=A0A494YTS9_9BACI|nr:energy-coupled thiamine transporter ThiT [Oceanobacillus bengalensis]RKQ13551.1 energy-coupled thiamine transporter ThiT [Oceanobacillus bengalensis]